MLNTICVRLFYNRTTKNTEIFAKCSKYLIYKYQNYNGMKAQSIHSFRSGNQSISSVMQFVQKVPGANFPVNRSSRQCLCIYQYSLRHRSKSASIYDPRNHGFISCLNVANCYPFQCHYFRNR